MTRSRRNARTYRCHAQPVHDDTWQWVGLVIVGIVALMVCLSVPHLL